MKTALAISILFFILITSAYSQDLIRIGVTHDFKKKKAVDSFSLDLNLTDKEESRPVKYFLFDTDGYYLLPSSAINIGDGVTASENNVMAQIKAGKMFYGSPFHIFSRNNTYIINQSVEINPSYNSDKNFEEKTAFAQIKILLNLIGQVSNGLADNPRIEKAFVATFGPYTNIGYRWSRELDLNKLYSTAGFFLDFKKRNMVKVGDYEVDDLSYRLYGNVYYIASDLSELYKERYAGLVKVSVIKRILNKTYLGISYKYGNDNPVYSTINVLELSFAVNY